MRKSLKSVLAAITLAGLGVAHSAVITFDGLVDSPYATGLFEGTGVLLDGDEFYQSGFWLDPFSNAANAQPGDLVGAIVDGSHVAETCWSVACPVNDPTTFYTSLNDGVLAVGRLSAGHGFTVKSFDASFIGASGAILPPVSGLLRVQGVKLNGASVTQTYQLPGPNAAGAFNFYSYNASGAFASTEFAYIMVYGFACDSAGSCSAFATDKAQFALDNLNLSEVPEPATGLLMGLGLLGAAVARRRRV